MLSVMNTSPVIPESPFLKPSVHRDSIVLNKCSSVIPASSKSEKMKSSKIKKIDRRETTIRFSQKPPDIFFIEHVKQMSKRDKSRRWWNAYDFHEMERESQALIEIVESGRPLRNGQNIRGLEKLTERGAVEYFSLRRDALSAVLEEQEFQKLHTHRVNQRELADAYKQTAIIPCRRALEKGRQDRLEVDSYLNDPTCEARAVRIAQEEERQKREDRKKRKLFGISARVKPSSYNLDKQQSHDAPSCIWSFLWIKKRPIAKTNFPARAICSFHENEPVKSSLAQTATRRTTSATTS